MVNKMNGYDKNGTKWNIKGGHEKDLLQQSNGCVNGMADGFKAICEL